MSSALGSIINPITSLVSGVAGVAFPPLGIAMSAANLLTQALGPALNGVVQQLTQQCGMPKFIGDIVQNVVKGVLDGLHKPSDPKCDQACHNDFGHKIQDFVKDFGKSVFDGAKSIMDQFQGDETSGTKGGGKKGGGNWLVAIAKAMGDAAGKHAEKLVDLSKQIESAQGAGGEEAKKVTGLQAEFQAESQLFSMLQNAFSNAIKSIGEGLSTMGRKG